MATFTPQEEAALLLADRSAVVNALTGLVLPGAASWFSAGHAAEQGIEHEHRPGGSQALTPQALAEYLAIAVPTHCADGWSYLSRALHAYLIGDPHSAWHFAYYAELRAAQSILSALGCGAFNRWNCALDANGQIHILGKHPTHIMVWMAIHFLSSQSSVGSAALASATGLYGESFPDIIQYAYPGLGATYTSSTWINEWLFDLETGADDKSFRNRCSYNPHITTPHRSDIGECVAMFAALWGALEPQPGAAFLAIDKQILRSALVREATASLLLRSGGVVPSQQEVQEELRAAYIRIISASPNLEAISVEYITDITSPEPLILLHAKDYTAAPDTPRPALARAFLLLRVASGMTKNLFRDAGQGSNLSFWLDELAERQGVVSNRADIPEDRSELYRNCADALLDMEEGYSLGRSNLGRLVEFKGFSPIIVSQAERVVQWGLLP